jgi:CheY-like chemotaxis protein
MNLVHREVRVGTSRMGALIARLDRAWRSVGPLPWPMPARVAPQQPPPSWLPRLLVVDDNPSNLGEVCDSLASCGITPTLAADGSEAAALACEHRFDLILMDLQMPVLDGLAATMRIRRFERQHHRRRVPVLAFSSRVPQFTLLRECGLDGFLEKPCSSAELQACLRHWCTPQDGSPVKPDGEVGGASTGSWAMPPE